MKLLAIETATEACSAALWLNGEVHERFELAPRRHTELILPMIDSLLTGAGLRPADMDAYAFGSGPGSFTGIRIATGVIQGLALAAGRPVIGISTLASLAQTLADRDRPVITALDARMGEVYWGCYEPFDGCMYLRGEEVVCPPGAVPVPESANWLAAGSGWDRYSDTLCARLAPCSITAIPDCWPRAGASIVLAAAAWRAGRTVSAAGARPTYLRDKVTQTK